MTVMDILLGAGGASAVGSRWTYRPGFASAASAKGVGPSDIAWTGDEFCVVGYKNLHNGSRSLIMTSQGGTNWQVQYGIEVLGSPTDSGDPSLVACSPSTTCVVYAGGFVATSPDCITWSGSSGLTDAGWQRFTDTPVSLIWTGTKFCVLGSKGGLATSEDGMTWSYLSGLSSQILGDDTANCIIWHNGYYYVGTGASATTTTGKVLRSATGSTWAAVFTPANSYFIAKLVVHNSRFLAILADGSDFGVRDANRAFTSDTGTTWTERLSFYNAQGSTSYDMSILSAGSHVLFSVTGRLLISSDCVNWRLRPNLHLLPEMSVGGNMYAMAWDGDTVCGLTNSYFGTELDSLLGAVTSP